MTDCHIFGCLICDINHMGPFEAIDASIPGGKKDGWWLKDPRGTWHQMLVPLKSRSELHSNGQRENCILKGAVKGAYRFFHPVLLLLLQASEVGEKKPGMLQCLVMAAF